MSIKSIVEQIYRDYENRNLEGVLAVVPEDFCFEWPFDPRNLRYAGVCRNKAEFVEKLQDLAKNFEFNGYRATNIIVDGNTVAAQIEMDLTSAKTGDRFTTKSAHFWTFENGKPAHLTEYADSALIAGQST